MSVFRDQILKGQVALVTGGGSGIGAGIALRFAEQGAAVTLLGRSEDKLVATAQRIEAAGGQVLTTPADVRDYAKVESAVKQTLEKFGRLDIVVNSAAGNFIAAAAGLSANGFKAVVDIDLLGTFNACRAAYEPLSRQGGNIVSITATQAWIPTPFQAHVGAAKAGIQKLTQDLALEWGASKIRVNAVAPGPIAETEGMQRLAPQDPEVRAKLERGLPVQRFGTISEVADAVLYLVSPAASFITGTTLVIDGGQALIGSARFMQLLGG
jgi:NAD(P)-dependent dehydrogenase (short-subunit alcohol dehydrogenase family)